MLWEQRWTTAEFHARCGDAETKHDARALVWGVFAGDGLVTSFRIAEDDTLADATDLEVSLADSASIGVVHPIHLTPAEVTAWATVIADYEIAQPFPQIGRPHERVDPDHLRAGVVPIERSASRVKLARLYSQGWLSDPADSWPFLRVDEDRRLKLDVGPMSTPDPILVKGLRPALGRHAGERYDGLQFAGIPLPFISEALGALLPLVDP